MSVARTPSRFSQPRHWCTCMVPLAYALMLAMPLVAAPPVMAQAAAASLRHYDIPAGNLDVALSRYGLQSGVELVVNGALTAGLQSPGVKGQYGATEALQRLLAGSGLEAVQHGDGYSLRRQPDRSGVAQLVPVAVYGALDSETEGSGSYAAARVSMAKGQDIREVPHAVSVVTRQRIEDQNLRTVADVLDKTTGLTLVRAGASAGSSLGNDTNFYSRGFAVSNVQLDGGAAMDTVMNGFGSVSQLDMAQYDHVEFMRGVDGLFSASGDPGGTINLVRKRAKAERQGTFSSSVGSWDNYRMEGDITGALNHSASVRGRAGVAYQDRHYFYETGKMRNRLVYGSLEFDLSPSTVLTLGGSYQDADGVPDFAGLPRYSTGADLGLARKTSLVPKWAHTHDVTREAYAKLEHQFNEDWSVNANALYAKMRRDHTGAYTFGAVSPSTGQGNYLYSFPEINEMHRVALDVNLKGSVDAFGQKHSVILGADYQRGKADSWQYMGYQGLPIDVFNPVFPSENLPQTGLKDSYYVTQKHAFYGALRMGLSDKAHLILGGRYSTYSYKNESWETTGTGYEPGLRHLRDSGVFTPYAGVTYDVSQDWTIYASYAETYRPQYMQRKGPAPGTPLSAVEAKNYELGVKSEWLDGRANATFALYRIEQTGESAVDPNYPMSYGAFNCCYVNQGKVISQGFEAEVNGEILRGLEISAGYTYNHNTDKNADRSYHTVTPKHLIKLWATYRLPEQLSDWRVGGGVVAQSATFVRGTAATFNSSTGQFDGPSVPFNFTQAGYAVWSARVDYRINQDWSLALNINNLFDKRYYATVGTSANGNFYGEPRNYYLTLRGTF